MSLAREGFVNALSNAIDLKSTDESYSILNDNSSSHLDRINAVVTILNAAAEHATSGNLNKYLTYRLGNIAIVTSLANLAEQSANGEASWTDYMAALGAYVSRWPGIPSKLLGAIFSLYPLAEDLGEQWGRDGTLDPLFNLLLEPYAPELYDFDAWIDEGVSTNLDAAKNFVQPRRDPLTLDLDNDGIETIGLDGSILFDHDADGIKQGTGWIASDDGLLVLDRDSNGTIDSGRELFGDNTLKSDGTLAEDGLDALADLDENADGQISAEDSAFNDLRVWRDLNSDGISQQDELFSLQDLDIVSIKTQGEEVVQDQGNGNLISKVTSFIKSDGSVGSSGAVSEVEQLAVDVDLANDPFFREFTDDIVISEEIAVLPDMQGSGAVRDLREAAQLDSNLAAELASYSGLASVAEQKAAIHDLLQAWADSAEYDDFVERINQTKINDTIQLQFKLREQNTGLGLHFPN